MADKEQQVPPVQDKPVETPVAEKPPVEKPAEKPAEKTAEVCTRTNISRKDLGELVEEANERFAHIGGDRYTYINQVFLPLLAEKGYVICQCK